ncbi:MAG: hypothetical protein AMJ81_08880 [Phycisphaerae bacterium SM23_33]|nr:MAG: hypothetical protein AMJ81_08880 [Phycisphaerae bacterium SM23_33]
MDFAHAPSVSLRPPVRKEYLRLRPPELRDQRGDIERIIGALRRRGYAGEIIAPHAAARSAGLVARAAYKLTVTVVGDHGAWHIIRLEEGDTTGCLYGAAVDVGTTTVVVTLVDLNTGKAVDAASSYNQQIIRCDDVASRISYASDPQRAQELRELVVDGTVNRLLRLLTHRHGLAGDDVAHMTVAGNTVMTHLFCGLSPTGLGAVPFAPISNFPGPYRAGLLNVAINAQAFVDIFPSAAAYVGGDATADMYVCGLARRDELNVLIDIGTNAEIVVGNRDRLIACAAPAGPAFEGHGLSCGMRAAAGAIESFRLGGLSDPPRYTVIGGDKPAGVCGSGLIDFVAQAFAVGVISSAGRFTDRARARCPRIRKLRRNEAEIPAYEIAPAEQTDDGLAPILITERDIATLLQAKGVIYAALQMAMKHFGKGFADIHRFYLAGGFAKHIDPDNAVTMGLLPDIDRGKFTFLGNGSLGGAFLALIDEDVRRELPHLAAAPAVIELNLDPEFMDAYTLAMFLPNGDPSLFPTVKPAK